MTAALHLNGALHKGFGGTGDVHQKVRQLLGDSGDLLAHIAAPIDITMMPCNTASASRALAPPLATDGRRRSVDQAGNPTQAETLGMIDLNGGALFNAEFGAEDGGNTVSERPGPPQTSSPPRPRRRPSLPIPGQPSCCGFEERSAAGCTSRPRLNRAHQQAAEERRRGSPCNTDGGPAKTGEKRPDPRSTVEL